MLCMQHLLPMGESQHLLPAKPSAPMALDNHSELKLYQLQLSTNPHLQLFHTLLICRTLSRLLGFQRARPCCTRFRQYES